MGGDDAGRRQLAAAHPRLAELQEAYGELTVAAPGAGMAGRSLASNLLELRLTCVAPSAGRKMGTQTKKVPGESPREGFELSQEGFEGRWGQADSPAALCG